MWGLRPFHPRSRLPEEEVTCGDVTVFLLTEQLRHKLLLGW